MDKTEEVKKCLKSVERLSVDLAGLSSLNLGGLEQQLVKQAFSHVDHITTNLKGVLVTKEKEPEPEQQQEQKPKRSFGSMKL